MKEGKDTWKEHIVHGSVADAQREGGGYMNKHKLCKIFASPTSSRGLVWKREWTECSLLQVSPLAWIHCMALIKPFFPTISPCLQHNSGNKTVVCILPLHRAKFEDFLLMGCYSSGGPIYLQAMKSFRCPFSDYASLQWTGHFTPKPVGNSTSYLPLFVCYFSANW